MLAFTILGLAGCAMALVALALDWRERSKWQSYTLDFGDQPVTRTTWPSDEAAAGWRVGETKPADGPLARKAE